MMLDPELQPSISFGPLPFSDIRLPWVNIHFLDGGLGRPFFLAAEEQDAAERGPGNFKVSLAVLRRPAGLRP
jgi:hypothetical protein